MQIDSTSIRQRAAHDALRPYWLVSVILLICIVAQFVNYRILVNSTDQELGNWNLVLMSLFDFLPWLLIAPIIIGVAKNHPPVALRPILLFHLPVSIICAISILALSTTARYFLEPTDVPYLDRLYERLFYEFTASFILYWFLVGFIFMTNYHLEYRRKAENELLLIGEKTNLERELFSLRLDALHAQFKPHFLFNALHTVSALMERDVTQARAALIRVSRLLRAALHFSDVDIHSLKAELDWLDDYVAVERLRLTNTFSFESDLAVDADQSWLPPLLLQPLVENAIHHGVGSNQHHGRIVITVTNFQGGLSVFVDDNGPGFGGDEDVDGFGIRLVRDRLRLAYGGVAQLEYEPSPLGGARAKVFLPSQGI